jgi:phosphocarrier protein HPr
MISRKVILHEKNGLHARPAMHVVDTCQKFTSQVTICKGCEKANGCSMMELLLLGARDGVELEVIASGEDEQKAVDEISELIVNGSGI